MQRGLDSSWGNASDRDVRSHLEDELSRLEGADPFSVLRVSYAADTEVVRRAFLALTKRYHPNRFARRDPTLRRLANEVFLRFNKAHDTLKTVRGREKALEKLGRAPDATPLPVCDGPTQPMAVAEGSEEIVLPAASKSGTADGKGKARSRSRTEPRTRRGRETGLSKALELKRKQERPTAPAPEGRPGRRSRAGSEPGATRRKRGTEPGIDRRRGGKRTRPGTEPGATRSRRTPTEPGVSRKPRCSRAPSQPRLSLDDTAQEMERASLEQIAREEAFDEAISQLKTGDLGSAMKTFKRIAAERPGEKKYRLYLTYARGRLHLMERRDEDARGEFRRALAIDNTFEPARRALEGLAEPDEDEKPGFLKKFFGKS